MSEAREAMPYGRSFDAKEHAAIVRGLVPREIEDRWFIFYEAPWLYLHRKFTGFCIYAVKLREEDGGSVVEEAWVNTSPEEYRGQSVEHDASMVGYLVDTLLLGRDVIFPVRAEFDPKKVDLLKQQVVGPPRRPSKLH
jgi:hypothetical protein